MALATRRYTWRHDSVLSNIEVVLRPYIASVNQRKQVRVAQIPHISKSFVSQGQHGTSQANTSLKRSSLLDGATDWKCLIDFDTAKIVFPPEILGTAERPDIIIWSAVLRTVILIELTCPAEEGIEAAQLRKEGRYADLVEQVKLVEPPWTPNLMTIEVGARGFVAHSVRQCFKRLGMQRREINALCKALSTVVARCSYANYLASSNRLWSHKALVTLSSK